METRIAGAFWVLPVALTVLVVSATLVLLRLLKGPTGPDQVVAIDALALLGTAPLAAHAVSRAAHRAGIKPVVGVLGDALEDVAKLEGAGEGEGFEEGGGLEGGENGAEEDGGPEDGEGDPRDTTPRREPPGRKPETEGTG